MERVQKMGRTEGWRESRKWAGGKGGQIGTRVSAKTIILINIFLRGNVWIVCAKKGGMRCVFCSSNPGHRCGRVIFRKENIIPIFKNFLCILSPWRCHFENSVFLRFPEELPLTTTKIRTCKSLHLTKINSALIHFSGLQKWLQSKNLILKKTFLKTRFKKNSEIR